MGMSLLEQILKLPKKNSQTVINVLLGIIIVGSVGGGLWIYNLQSTLAERDSLVRERLNAIDERYKTNLYHLYSKVDKVEEGFIELQNSFDSLEPVLSTDVAQLRILSSDQQFSHETQIALSSTADDITTTTNTLRSQITELNEPVQILVQETEPFKDYGLAPMYMYSPSFLSPLVCASVVLILFVLGIYLRRHLKIK